MRFKDYILRFHSTLLFGNFFGTTKQTFSLYFTRDVTRYLVLLLNNRANKNHLT